MLGVTKNLEVWLGLGLEGKTSLGFSASGSTQDAELRMSGREDASTSA